MVGWDHQLNGHEFEKTPGDSEGERIQVGYSPWNHKERLNNTTKDASWFFMQTVPYQVPL